jgi:hypothetical protein
VYQRRLVAKPANIRPNDGILGDRNCGAAIQTLGAEPLVGVDESEDPTGGGLDTRVARGGDSLSLRVADQTQSGTLDGITAAIRGTIVDDDDLHVLSRRIPDRLDRTPEFTTLIMSRDDDAKSRHVGSD